MHGIYVVTVSSMIHMTAMGACAYACYLMYAMCGMNAMCGKLCDV